MARIDQPARRKGCAQKAKWGCFIFFILGIVPPVLVPLLWYGNDVKYKSYHIIAHVPLTGLEVILDSVDRNLHASPLYDGKQTFEAMLSGGHFEYSLFAPFARDAFGATYKLFNTTFITETDVAKDIVHSAASEYNVRTLTGVLTHEFTHQMLNNSDKDYSHDETWKVEGYCDYIARESSLDSTTGNAWLRAGKSDDSEHVPHSYRYFVDRKLVQYELETKRLSVDQLMNDAESREAVLAEYRRSILGR